MAAAVQPRRPRHRWHAPEKGSGPAFALSLLAHALLFIAIAFVVQWKSEPIGTVSAELWSLPPTAVQPPPPAPPPLIPPKVEPPPPEPPRKADIVEEKKPPPKKEEPKKEPPKKEEPKKIDPPKKVEPPKNDEAKLAQQEAAQLKAAAEARLKQLLAQAGTSPAAVAGGGSSEKYAAQVITCIRPHIVFNVPDSISAQQHVAVFEVMLLPTGEQTGAPRLIKGSGLAAYDLAVERAIRRCDPFPPPREGTMPRSIRLLFDPVETR
jgi:colicin import membrane protein